jgi:hypothetical protein
LAPVSSFTVEISPITRIDPGRSGKVAGILHVLQLQQERSDRPHDENDYDGQYYGIFRDVLPSVIRPQL